MIGAQMGKDSDANAAPSVARRGRLAWPKRDQLDSEQLVVYLAIVEGARSKAPRVLELTDEAGRLEGPFNAMLVNPKVGGALQELGSAVRYASSLSDRQREIAILELAVLAKSDFEWYAHERIGRSIGLDDIELGALLTAVDCDGFRPEEITVRRLVRALYGDEDLDDELFEEGADNLGHKRIADLVVLVGYYRLLALSLTVWRTPLPKGIEGPWSPAPRDSMND